MDSKDNHESDSIISYTEFLNNVYGGIIPPRDSIISYTEFLNNIHGGIIPPPPPPAWASATNDDAVAPQDIEMSAIQDRPLDPSSMTHLPSSNMSDAWDATRSGRGYTEEEMEEFDDDHAPLPPETIAASFEAVKPTFIGGGDDTQATPDSIAASFEGHSDEEEKREEVHDEGAPLPPEMIAASFEAAKPELIEDYDDALVIPEQIAAPFDGHGDEEENREKFEDDNAQVHPEVIDSLFEEAAMPELIGDDGAPLPPDVIVASFEGHGEKKEKREECEDDVAPRLPEMIAASYKDTGATDQEAIKKPPVSMEGAVDPQVPEERFPSAHEAGENIQNVHHLREDFNNHVTPDNTASQEFLSDPYSSSNLQYPTTSRVQVGAFATTPTPMIGDEPSLAVGNQGHEEIAIYPTHELMSQLQPSIDLIDDSLPLLEGTLVQDLPEERVYDAFPMNTTQDNDANGWSRRFRKYRVILFGLVLVTAAAIIAVVVLVSSDKKNEWAGSNDVADPIMTSTTSTTVALEVYSTITPNISPSEPPTEPSLWKPQGEVVIGDEDLDNFGFSVALSADAKTLVVGAPGDDYETKKGYVKVYFREDIIGSTRTQLGQTIHGEAVGDEFGLSVDISADGKFLAIGSPGSWMTDDRPGYVRVYRLESRDDLVINWKQVGQDIIGDAIADEFGTAVSLSDDGKTLAVGAWQNDVNGDCSGHVRIYHLVNSMSWERLGQDIVGEGDDLLGVSVSLSGNGTTVAIGAPWNSDNGTYSGYVKVYRIDSGGSSWEQLGETIYGEESDTAGYSVDITPDEKTLAVGFPGYLSADSPGYVRNYRLESNDNLRSSWKQYGQDILGEVNGDNFGISVSLSDDGKTLAVGANYNDGKGDSAGHVRVYRMDDTKISWEQLGEDIDGDAAEDQSGLPVSLSADGQTVSIGSGWNDDNGADSGHVRVFTME